MSKIVAFNVPVKSLRARNRTVMIDQRRGRACVITIGDRAVRFMLQYGPNGKACTLAHFASGYRFGSLDDARVRAMCALGHHARLTDRQAAESLVARVVAKLGAAEVLAKLDAAPVLNAE